MKRFTLAVCFLVSLGGLAIMGIAAIYPATDFTTCLFALGAAVFLLAALIGAEGAA